MVNKSKTHQEEYLDIVDENNIPTGKQEGRVEVHKQGLWHKTVHIFIFRTLGDKIQFLVHLRSKDKDLHPSKWATCFGGHLKAGESVEEAIQCELMDEVGLQLDSSDLIQGEVYKRDNHPNRELVNVFYYNYGGDISVLKFNDGEVQRVEWMEAVNIIQSISEKPEKWAANKQTFIQVLSELKNKISKSDR